MDSSLKNTENLHNMIEKILEKLKIINISAIKPTSFSLDQYDDVHEIYQLVMKRNNLSPSEIQAIAEELGNIRRG